MRPARANISRRWGQSHRGEELHRDPTVQELPSLRWKCFSGGVWPFLDHLAYFKLDYYYYVFLE